MQNILKWVGLFGKFFGAAGAVSSLANIVPAAWMPYCLVIAVAGSGLKDVAIHVGDLLDDGQKNDSFKIPVVLFLVAFLCLGAGTGCTSLKYSAKEKDGREVTMKATGFLSNKAITKLSVDGKTEKTTKGLTVGSVTDDVEGPIKAAEGVARAMIDQAITSAAKTVKP